ncbi:actin-related protein 5 [Nematocida sp. AWRm80]|nr:actin-related protein 5 [Nematocida sp. AWRm80]
MTRTLGIDNGTFICRAGTNDKVPEIEMKNQITRVKNRHNKIVYLIEGRSKRKPHPKDIVTVKNMFDGPVVYNYDVLAGTIQAIIDEIDKEIDSIVITECFLNPKYFKDQALNMLFDTFPKLKWVRFEYDCISGYEYNMANNKKVSHSSQFNREYCDVVISMGHQGVYIVPVDPEAYTIMYSHSTFIPLGGLLARSVFYNSICLKYIGTGIRPQKEEVDRYFNAMKVSLEYFKEAEEIVTKGKENIIIEKKQLKEKGQRPKIFPRKRQKTESTENQTEDTISPIDTPLEEEVPLEGLPLPKEEEEKVPEEEVPLEPEQELKRERTEKLMKGAREHRYKQNILKALHRLSQHTLQLEDTLLQQTDPQEHIKLRRTRLAELEKRLKQRKFVRNELKNKKSVYSLALLKHSLASANTAISQLEVSKCLEEINDSLEDDLVLLEEIDLLEHFLLVNDPEYVSKKDNPVDLLRYGQSQQMTTNINIELIRTPEALFNPKIIGIEQPGITEALSEIFQIRDIRNILITGGFSKLPGLKERIEKEIESLRYTPNNPVVSLALDPETDGYKGLFLSSKYFKTYSREEYEKEGTDLIKEHYI